MKALRWVAIGAGALALVAAAVVAYLVLTFDPKAYTARVAEVVKRETGRTLTVDGPVRLTVLPKLGVSVGKVTVSAPNRPDVFARIDEARVTVAIRPLLSRRVVADRLTLKGLSVDLVRARDGRTNFDDLTGGAARTTGPGGASPRAPSRGLPLAVDVGAVEIDNATIGLRDERDGIDLRLANVNATTGRLGSDGAPGTLALSAHVQGAQPSADLRLDMTATYRLELAAGTVVLSAVDAKMAGRAQPLGELNARVASERIDLDPTGGRAVVSRLEVTTKTAAGLDATVTVPRIVLFADRTESEAIAGAVTLAAPGRRISAKLRTAPLALTGRRGALSRVDVDFSATQADLSVQGALVAGGRLDLDARRAEFSGISGNLTLTGGSLPGPAKGTLRGSGGVDWSAESANADLAVAVDGSHVDAKLAVAHWTKPAITFTVAADRLDVDRYFPPSKPAPASAAGGAGGGTASGRRAPPAEQPFDLSPLRGLTATGTVKLGFIRVSNLKAEQVSFAVAAAGGVVRLDPISAALYQGRLAGTAVVNANDGSVALKQRLSGVSIAPLLRDLADHDLLEGRGDIALDVTATGKTVAELKRALAGSAAVVVKDGAVKGVDVPAVVATAQTLLGSNGALERPAQTEARTAFSSLTGTFQIRRGVAHNEDLLVTSPLLRITGRGDVDVGAATVDYTTTATFTGDASTVGKDLGRLAGMTVPIRTTGSLEKPTYTVDVAALAAENVKTLLPRELQRRLGRDKPDGSPGSGSVGDLLRDLLGGKPKPPK